MSKKKELRPKPTLSRDYLIKELSHDVIALQNNPACIRDLIRKYIVLIDVFDGAIKIHSMTDLFGTLSSLVEKFPEKEKTAGTNSDGLITSGCGGPQVSVLKLRVSRPFYKIA